MKPVNAVQIIREALAAYGAHAATVLTVSLLINGVALVASIVAMNVFGMVGLFIFGMITVAAQQVSNGAFASLMSSRWAGDDLSSSQDVIRPALARVGALFGAAFLYSLGVGFAALLFVLPAIYLATKWAVVFPAIVIGRQRVGEAFKQSSQYTSQAMDSVFAVVLFNFLLSVITPRIITGVAGGQTAPMEMTVIATFAVSALFGPISGLAIGELYLRLAPPVTAGGPTIGRGAWVPVAQQAPAAASGPWVPMPAAPQPAMGATAYASPGGAPAPYGAPAAQASPYGAPAAQPAPYGGAPQAPAYQQAPGGYGAPAQAPTAYGTPAPAPYGTPPAAYGAPAPQPYGAPAQQPYGAPAQHAAPAMGAPAPYGAPPTPGFGEHAAQQSAYGAPAGHPAQPAYAAPAQPQPAYAAPTQPQAAYGAPGTAPTAPAHAPQAMHQQMPGAAPIYAQPGTPGAATPAAPAPYGAPPVAGAMPPGLAADGGPVGPRHPGREQSVAPPGLG